VSWPRRRQAATRTPGSRRQRYTTRCRRRSTPPVLFGVRGSRQWTSHRRGSTRSRHTTCLMRATAIGGCHRRGPFPRSTWRWASQARRCGRSGRGSQKAGPRGGVRDEAVASRDTDRTPGGCRPPRSMRRREAGGHRTPGYRWPGPSRMRREGQAGRPLERRRGPALVARLRRRNSENSPSKSCHQGPSVEWRVWALQTILVWACRRLRPAPPVTRRARAPRTDLPERERSLRWPRSGGPRCSLWSELC
jgi:hypothetical protein